MARAKSGQVQKLGIQSRSIAPQVAGQTSVASQDAHR